MKAKAVSGGLLAVSFLTLVGLMACAVPTEATDDDAVGSSSQALYAVGVMEKPTCCPSNGCCKKWCDYNEEKCTGDKCVSDRVACYKRCDSTHG